LAKFRGDFIVLPVAGRISFRETFVLAGRLRENAGALIDPRIMRRAG
jgi:hypothetical protein